MVKNELKMEGQVANGARKEEKQEKKNGHYILPQGWFASKDPNYNTTYYYNPEKQIT